jgi:hypothetical protein
MKAAHIAAQIGSRRSPYRGALRPKQSEHTHRRRAASDTLREAPRKHLFRSGDRSTPPFRAAAEHKEETQDNRKEAAATRALHAAMANNCKVHVLHDLVRPRGVHCASVAGCRAHLTSRCAPLVLQELNSTGQIKDVLQCVLHTILFVRAPGPVRPREVRQS